MVLFLVFLVYSKIGLMKGPQIKDNLSKKQPIFKEIKTIFTFGFMFKRFLIHRVFRVRFLILNDTEMKRKKEERNKKKNKK
jgi:hypothetical protein